MKLNRWTLMGLAGLAISQATLWGQGGNHLVLAHANLIDGASASVQKDVTVLIEGTTLRAIYPAGSEVEIPHGARRLDLQGRYLLPGLIDAHVHLNAVAPARLALRSGVTTARNLGSVHFAGVGLRELGRRGAVDIPEILACGYHVRPQLASQLFLDVPALSDLMNGVQGTDNARRVVRMMLERKVDQIKINATERAGTVDTDPRKRLWSDKELMAIVDEAGKRGVSVAAHAHGDEGGYAAVQAGVRSIEHGTYLSSKTLALMKEKGTYLVPTIAVVTDLMTPGGQYDNAVLQARGRAMYYRLRKVVTNAFNMGVKIAAATDGGYGPQSWLRLQQEIEELTKVGMPNMQAIQSATSVAAELLGISNRTGVVRSAMEADLIVIENNPLEDIRSLQDVLLVVNNGKVVLDRLTW